MTPSTSRRLLTLVPLALSLLAGAALWPSGTASAATAGSGRAATEARAVAPFEAIAVQGDIELEVRQSDAASLAVTADDNLLPLLETVVEGGTATWSGSSDGDWGLQWVDEAICFNHVFITLPN